MHLYRYVKFHFVLFSILLMVLFSILLMDVLSMAGRINTCSISFCFIFCFFLIFGGKSRRNGAEIIPWNDGSAYFVCQTVIASRFGGSCLRAGQNDRHFDNWFAVYHACKLVQHASLGLMLVALSGDIEVNPGYHHVEDLKDIKGLKIAHLNVQSAGIRSIYFALR